VETRIGFKHANEAKKGPKRKLRTSSASKKLRHREERRTRDKKISSLKGFKGKKACLLKKSREWKRTGLDLQRGGYE